jgi:hypothetical protein
MGAFLFLVVASAFIGIGRLTVPGNALRGWPGAYEAFAHLLLGAMIAIAFLVPEERTVAVALVVGLSLFELAMFEVQKKQRNSEK